ncbi:hypothetical protein [Labrenzia sp. CE80]|uniref:hypothetical protein n=1 Tax=Labrenzia sp. CE80 TaxID=1788986 RepID=UPI00129B8CC7|nr:hypothetical protein [Labrenzia sp. CE80]
MLRQERHPLAILAMLALGLRVTVIMVGLAISPGVAGEGLGILCQTSSDEDGRLLPSGGKHDPAHCICGTGCSHISQFSATPQGAAYAFEATDKRFSSRPGSLDRFVSSTRPWTAGPIRAPPFVLT